MRGDRARRGGLPHADLRPRRPQLALAARATAREEQKQRYLVPQARGEKLACFGLTEPGAGSDVAAMRTTARREGDIYVLNGQKNWISYATVADHQLVFAKTDPAAKHKGISAFVVEREWPGVTTRETENKLGIWAGSTGELFFENVEVPAENLVGEEGQGFEIAMYGLDQGRFTVAAGAVRRRPRLPRALGRVRARARDVRPADRQVPVRAGHDRRDGARLRDLEAARHAGGVDEEPGRAQHARDVAGEVARDRVGVQGRAPRDPGARLVRLLGRVRDRALLPQRARADHLRGHDADPQADAGRARARLPEPERPHRRDVADGRLGALAARWLVAAPAVERLRLPSRLERLPGQASVVLGSGAGCHVVCPGSSTSGARPAREPLDSAR